jgi:hypothetical protein
MMRREVVMAIRSIVIASACAVAAAMAFSWGFTSFGPSEASVEVQEVPEQQAWRVEVEEVNTLNANEQTTATTQFE